MSFSSVAAGLPQHAGSAESSGYVPFTRREDKERAARIVQRRVRDKKVQR